MVGIVGIDLNMDHLNQQLSALKVGENGYITLYDSANQIVFHPDSSLLNTNAQDANYSSNMLDAIVNKSNINATLYTRNGTEYYGSTNTIESLGYTVLGVVPVTEFTAQTSAIVRVLIIGMIFCGILLGVVSVILALSITKPLKRLNVSVGQLADGELDVTVDTHGRDEVAEVGMNVARIVQRLKEYILYINEISMVLNQIGEGNLKFTLQYEYAGEFSKVKASLLNIRHTLTETLVSISQSADQINAGSEQISIGAQALAQGATEQASSVQELSGQATEEAEKAVKAGQSLEHIKEEVEQSNAQMDTLRKAMEDISVQSTAIRSIIKTIDDIAFQTNILALNAAVEAARAGAAGKGFAVVADEVRNLASKSAEAAKKTNDLIEGSVQAVERGEELTKLTAEKLSIVTDGTKEVAETIDAVALAYHDQADKLAEISLGVEQIASVVQTNSATAEESAAASEELSGQANMMRQQIAHFQLEQDFT